MSLGNYSLGPEARLRSRKEFDRLFILGRKTAGRNLILWHVGRDDSAPTRLGLSVSAKLGCAPKRNRLKRLVREAFRLDRPRLRRGMDMVVYIRPGCRWKGLDCARKDLAGLWRQEGILSA